MSEYVEKVLHVKSEDLRLYDLTDEENPVHLDNEGLTVAELQFRDGQKLLVESENKPPHIHSARETVCGCIEQCANCMCIRIERSNMHTAYRSSK